MKTASLAETSRRLKALSDPTRLKILAMLSKRALCVCELTFLLGLAQPTVSRHLRQLDEAGFLAANREGNWITYEISPGDRAAQALLSLALAELEHDETVKALMDGVERVSRHELARGVRCLREDAA